MPDQITLSPEDFEELKLLVHQEFGPDVADEEINDMGARLLQLYSLLATKESDNREISLSAQVFTGLQYVHLAIVHKKESPSTRGLAKAIGLRSSRSGHRFICRLIERGFVHRNDEGSLELADYLQACKSKITWKVEGSPDQPYQICTSLP